MAKAKLINAETGKSTIAFVIKTDAGKEQLSQFDTDVLTLMSQIPVPSGEVTKESEVFKLGTPRRLLAALAIRYSGLDVKAVTGRLRFFNKRGLVDSVETSGLIFPGWHPTNKCLELVSKLKAVASAHPEKHQLNIDLKDYSNEVMAETASINGRYKVAREKTNGFGASVEKMEIE